MVRELLGGLATAFTMYSVLPMPQVQWKKSTMKYAMCFFPLVGGCIGAAVWGWLQLCRHLTLGAMLTAGGVVLLPLLLTGGIHLDGFIDSCDALGSHLEKQRKLEILKDPHVGAFGVIYCGALLLASYALAGQFAADTRWWVVLCAGFVLSRSMSAAAVVSFPMAKKEGLVYLFSDSAEKNTVRATSFLYALLALLTMAAVNWRAAAIAAAGCVVLFWLFWRMCMREFDGLSGDLAGFLLCVTELWLLAVAALAGCFL